MNEPIVYCIQEPIPFRDKRTGQVKTKDLSSASRYGDIRFLLDQNDRPSLAPTPSLLKIKKGLRSFRPGEDFLVNAGGDWVGMLLLGAALRDLNTREIVFLRWEKERDLQGRKEPGVGFYVPMNIKLF